MVVWFGFVGFLKGYSMLLLYHEGLHVEAVAMEMSCVLSLQIQAGGWWRK